MFLLQVFVLSNLGALDAESDSDNPGARHRWNIRGRGRPCSNSHRLYRMGRALVSDAFIFVAIAVVVVSLGALINGASPLRSARHSETASGV